MMMASLKHNLATILVPGVTLLAEEGERRKGSDVSHPILSR